MQHAKKSTRIIELDLLRFIAATIVFFFHVTFRGKYFEIYDVTYPALEPFFAYGFFGVDLFFLISGFVIFMSVQKKTASEFVISRVIRLYPAFWLAVTLTFIGCLLWSNPIFRPTFPQYLVNLTMLAGYMNIPSIDGVYWTLYVELLFYLYIFILVFFKLQRFVLFFFAAWLALSFVSMVTYIPYTIEYYCNLKWSQYFVGGAVMFLIRQRGYSPSLLALLAASYILALLRLDSRVVNVSSTYGIELSYIAALVLISSFYGLILLIISGRLQINGYAKFIGMLGSLSYPIYLLHHNLGFIFMSVGENYLGKYTLLLALSALVLLGSYALVKYERSVAPKLRNLLSKPMPAKAVS